MAHLGSVRNCVDWLNSNEATKRKNGMKQLRDLMNDQTILQELNNSSSSSDVNWTHIFSSAHNLLIKESEKIKSEERKGAQSSAAVWRRNSLKNDCASLVVIIVNKANQGVPRIMCSVLITSILQVLSDHYLRKNYSDKYTEIVRSSLLPRQEYRSKLGEEHWTDLSAVFWRLFREPPQQLEMSAVADVLNGIVKFGCAQSFIGLKLKKKFSVLAEAFLDDNFLKSSVGTQEAFLRLATSMCLEIGKECRMAVCHLGEMIVPRVLHLYDKLSKEKNLVVEFLLLQVRLHHPAGASRSDVLGAAYASNWDLWHSHLRSMFALVDSELSYTHTKKQKATVISNTFLQLAVEVCKQVFHEHSRANSNQSINVHESTSSPVLKKRRIAGGLRDIVNNISKMNTPKECWPWLTFLSEYISRYCETVMSEDYVSLLTVVTDQLNSCRDTLLMAHLCRCCSSLLKVDKNLREDFVDSGVVVKLWKNILDVVLRMIGLNQNEQESHYLLQEMISYNKVSGSLLDVLELYVKGTLRQSDTALKTLIVICNHIRLPEKIVISRRPHAVHNSLITWLLPEHKEIEVFSPSLLANVLALICFKPSAENVTCEPSREQITSFAEELFQIEENYCITSFESSICKPVHKIAGHRFSYATSSSFRASVDEEALRTLEEALERNCQQLLEDVVTVSEGERLKQITNIFCHCELLLELWSWMIRFNTIPVDKVPSFFGRIKILIEKLNDNCTKEIFCHEPSVATKFMQNLSHIMELQHHQAVHKEMRSIIPNNFLTVVHSILTTKNLWGMAVRGEDNDERDEFAVERTSKRGEQTYGSVSLFDTETFSEREKVQLHCVKVLSSYCCYPGGTILSECQDNCLSKLLSLFVSGIGVNTAATFYMAVVIMQKVLEMDSVRRQHIDQCLKVLQGMCRSFHLDYEAAAFIMKLLQGLLRFVQDIGESRDKENTVALLRGLQHVVCKKQYGAKVVAQYIRCLGELAKVDSDASWSLWRVGTKLPGSIVRDETPIAEEILLYVQHPFHELRMMAITFIPTLFGCFEEQKIEKLQWQSNMFESLCKIIMEAFVVEGELSEQERIDESANRTSTALHSVAALLMSNSILRKKSLFFLLQLIREKNISLDLVKKSLAIAGNAMNIIGSKLIAANLKYLFTHWCLSKYQVQEFPWLLLECSSEADFYTTHLKTIVPVLFFNRDLDIIEELCLKVGKDLKLVTEVCSPYIIGHLLPIFTMKNSKEMYNYNIFNAEQLLKQLEKILSEDQVKCLLSENMDIVIVTIFRLLFDVHTVTALCGYTSSLPEPAPPTIKSQQMLDTLEYLQKNSQAPEVKLILFLSKNKPRVIQKILLQLAVDIHQQLTCEEMIISLHRYAAFADLLGCNLTESSLNALSTFVIREVIHQLINIVRQAYQQNQEVLSIAACNCLLHFLDKCLPVKAVIVEKFLGMCTSVLVPVVKSGGYVAAEACRVLEFIIVKNAECLSSGIRLLGPFPAQPKFNEIQKVYQRTVYGGKQYTLEEEIKYFLEAEMYSSCHVERLKHLYLQLSLRKTELRDLYLSLKNLRGFSEDCEESILHRLLCVLVGLTSAEDKEVQLGASRCLGEIGPSDLATLVLQPEKETDENIVLTEDIVVLLIGSVLKKLSVALVDENINVVKETSSALYTILASKEARKFLESEASRSLNQDYIMPFINHKKSRHDISLDVDTELFRKLVDCRDTWTPGRSTHEKWITNLVCSILQTFDAEKNFLPHLIPVCRVKVSLCEAVLPYLLDLVLAGKEKVCSSIVIHHLQHFFKEHFQKHLLSVKKLNTLSEMRTDISGPEFKLQVIMNRASVQCMLDVVHFLRMRRHAQQRISGVVIELDFLHISLAAQFCSAYFTSILYAELWCHEKLGSPMDTDKMSLLESICLNDKENGQILQHILWEAYTKIGDSDAVYGCWPSNTLDYQSCIQHLKLKAKWDRVLQAHDLELCSGNSETVPGLLNALQKFGLHHVMDGYICSSFVREHLPVQKVQNYYYDCAWRLANWNTDIYFSDASTECFQVESDVQKELHPGSYERYHYLAMNAIQNLDEDAFKKNLRHARSCVVESLAHASLETSKFLYTVLSQLRALQEMEDFFEVISENDSKNVDPLLKKWNQQNLIQYNDFDNVEPILTQRIVMLKTSARKGLVNPYFQKVIVNLSLDIAALARTEKHFQVAAHYVQSLSAMSSLPPETAVNLKIEEARLLWDRDDKELALCILKGLLSKPGNTKGKWHALSLKLYGDWMVETKSENAQVIISDYFFKALETLESNETGITETKIETYWSIASFADSQYQQLSCYFKSAEYEVKQKYLEKALNDVERLKQQAREGGTLNEDEKRAYRMHERQTQIDRAEIANRRKEMDMYLTTAIRYYILGLECDDTHDLQVFRVAHLWLENTLHNDLNAVLNESLFRVPSYKFLPLLPQLIPHMSHMEDAFSRKINMLIEQCAVDHPHHSLQQILALSNSHKDKEICGVDMQSVIYESRVIGAQQMVERLKKSSGNIAPLLQQMEKVAAALISLAYYSSKDNSKTGQIPRGELLTKLKNCDTVLVPTLTIPVKPNCQYSNIIGIAGFEKTYQMVGGVNAPKKIVCIGTDGIKRPQLVKGRDDLRQDAVMQQVFTMMNTFLRRNKETSKRKLLMRTYKVVPLSQRSGIIEWCDNTEVLAIYLIGSDLKSGAHRRYYPSDLSGLACRKKMKDVASESNEKKLEVYKEICKSFRPVLHKFFLEYFPAPSIWFERRLAYIHSVATSSMIGYILGLGDRHVNNILIDKQTAEVIHIDFGIAFEMGRILPTPETVPFRLTRDIVDGMGASGVEGVFRRCCEKTMSVLRQNQETILTILEVLLYDPLYSWSVTPKKAYNLQSNSGSLGDETDAGEETSNEVNKMAERALLRLRQKLHGTEEGSASSIAGQVNRLIQQAIDPVNLSRLYNGWQPYL
ncbi:serine-protein kinase ATM isoform X1 [Schistocerca gregaria]|uniref:serine-protein kinase ATM isoform X1 n=1 Tax=Schistocerca gregaria TaxID=7010 RepID=UPI00211E39C2|nr:serine-protein kinase ATM isoform X1 [Schistocerca gregaria]XP_049852037.1 serine-protein kinase ATM isoform X1 [Schistocerca gregaria]